MPRTAVVHDWLTLSGGAERVLEQILLLHPDADLYTVVDFLPERERAFLQGRIPRTSFIQSLPFARRRYRQYLGLMPYAVEQFDLSAYDLVISSSYAVAKGVLTGPDQVHVSYVHSPMRYAWDLTHQYLEQAGLTRGLGSVWARWLLHRMRLWDARTPHGVDQFVANSHFVRRRISKAYGRDADVVYPPVDLARFRLEDQKEDFYLTVSRLVPYKRIDVVVEAFRLLPDRRLVVVGDGPEYKRIRAKAGPNVEFTGYLADAEVQGLLERARAFLFAAEEDFGIAPLEAQASGTPAILYGKGGGLETVRGLEDDEPTGVFFESQTPESVRDAVLCFEAAEGRISPDACRRNAERFSAERFRREFAEVVERERRALEARKAGGRRMDAPAPRRPAAVAR